MIFEPTIFWLIGYYLFCAVLTIGYWAVYRLLNYAPFRSDQGDITTEVGYSENSLGDPVLPDAVALTAGSDLL